MKRISLVIFWILTATVLCSAQATFYYPHIANGLLGANVWKTTIFLTNPTASGTASGTITFTRDNAVPGNAGSIFSSIAFVDQDGAPAGSGGIITFSIPAGQTRKYTSTGAGAYGGGFATVTTTAGSVQGTAVFSEFDLAGGLIAEAGVPSASAVPNQAIFVDTVGGFSIGVAYANPNSAAGQIDLSLLNSSAVTVATTTVPTFGAGNHGAAFTFQMFPGAGQFAGTMQIHSTQPLAAIALRFAPSGVFTTLPPVTLASLISPAVEWFEQRPWFAPLTSVARLLGAFQLRRG